MGPKTHHCFYGLIPFNKIVLPAATLTYTLCRRKFLQNTQTEDEYFNKGQYSKGQQTDKERKTHVHSWSRGSILNSFTQSQWVVLETSDSVSWTFSELMSCWKASSESIIMAVSANCHIMFSNTQKEKDERVKWGCVVLLVLLLYKWDIDFSEKPLTTVHFIGREFSQQNSPNPVGNHCKKVSWST